MAVIDLNSGEISTDQPLPPQNIQPEAQSKPGGVIDLNTGQFVANQPVDIDIQQTPQPQKDFTFGRESVEQRARGGFGAIPTLLSGALAEPFAGIAGVVQSLNPFAEEGAGARAVEATREALITLPETEFAEQKVTELGETLKPLSEAFSTAESTLGEAVQEATGSAELAAIAHTLPTAPLEL